MDDERRRLVKELASQFLDRGDPLGWFDETYRRAEGDVSLIPWADKKANPALVEWLFAHAPGNRGLKALVVGCGLGDDAELLTQFGYQTWTFDISPTAVAWCARRFPDSKVRYETADLFVPPASGVTQNRPYRVT